MIRKAATAAAAFVVLLSAAGCSAPTEPRYPEERGDEDTQKTPPAEALRIVQSAPLHA